MLSLFKVLQTRSGTFFVNLTMLGIVNAVTQVGILYIINKTLSFKPLPFFPEYNWLFFLSILMLSFFATLVFQRYLIRLANETAYEFSMNIFDRIRNTSVLRLLSTGKENVYTAMDDVDQISAFPVQFINIMNSMVIVFCGLGFMFTTSVTGALILIAVMILLVIVYVYRNTITERCMNEVRDLENTFYQHLNDLLNGFKELSMSSVRNNNLHDKYIRTNRENARDLRIKASKLYLSNDLTGTFSWYLVMGVLLFGFSRISELGVAGSVTFTFILFYMMGPLAGIIRSFPLLTRSKIAYERLSAFLEQLAKAGDENKEESNSLPENFSSLRIEDVCFRYHNTPEGFNIGPVNITVNKGECIFLTGGNGSGKSTFLQLVSGLLTPSSGKIYFNDAITQSTTSAYRDRISALFTDPFLFSKNYEDYRYSDVRESLQAYFLLLKMDGALKVSYEQDTIDKDLSKGQQKRLALILALLEKKPILLMDEWAAEQDPVFRKYFYEEIIPALKAKGKTLLVVTHDDRYFQCADRIIKFEHGKILTPQKSPAEVC